MPPSHYERPFIDIINHIMVSSVFYRHIKLSGPRPRQATNDIAFDPFVGSAERLVQSEHLPATYDLKPRIRYLVQTVATPIIAVCIDIKAF